MVIPLLKRFLVAASQRQDLLVVGIVLMAISMMLLPVPPLLLDMIIGINMSASVAIMVTTFYLKSPTQIATFPALLLVTAMMRLSCSVAATRLVLLEGHAGDIITAFGNFVVGGNLVVGLVVFLILTVVNFMVITKGSERVAEVSARFTLDAMPGKQMSIDAELKSGDIDKAEAAIRRENLQTESQFFGSMDGAMKFVKGDAIASIIIVTINLIGGITIGVVSNSLTFSAAAAKYSVLSIGDGLVAQIPSLLISVASGIIITRIATSRSKSLGQDIIRDITSDQRTSSVVAVVLFGLGCVPGFPTSVFWFLSIVFVFCAAGGAIKEFFYTKILKRAIDHEAVNLAAEPEEKIRPGEAQLRIVIDEKLMANLNTVPLLKRIRKRKNELCREYGILLPPLGEMRSVRLRPNFFLLELDGIPVAEGELRGDCMLVKAEHGMLDLAGIEYVLAPPMFGMEKRFWVNKEFEPKLRAAGIGFMSAEDTLLHAISECIRRNLGTFFGLQEAQEWMNDAARVFPDMVNEARQILTPQKCLDVFKRLLGDNVSLAGKRPVIEALISWGGREEDSAMLSELVRVTLRRRICFNCADENKTMVAAVFEQPVEEMIRKAVRRTNMGDFLALEEKDSKRLLQNIRRMGTEPRFMAPAPIILCAIDLRRFVRSFLVKQGLDFPVLSHQDIAEDFTVQVIYAITP